MEKHKSVSLLESPCREMTSNDSKNLGKGKRRSQIKSSSPVVKKPKQSPTKCESKIRNIKVAKAITEIKTLTCPDNVNSSVCVSSSTMSGDAVPREASPLQKKEKKIPKRPSLSAIARSFSLPSQSLNVASGSAEEDDDDVFEDFFSRANQQKKVHTPLSSNLTMETDIQIPFEFGSIPKKRKQRRSESITPKTNSMKKMKLEKSQSGRNPESDSNTESKSRPQHDVKESLPALDGLNANATLIAKGRRQSKLPFINTNVTKSDPKTHIGTSTAVRPKANTQASELKQNSDVSGLSHTLESE